MNVGWLETKYSFQTLIWFSKILQKKKGGINYAISNNNRNV